ncbi:ribonucleoside-diphosphate reductase subunit alpha [Sporosarcina sp. Marseille-Q4063]|uniref:ribonucleoside-diphosphate reductase subunit alpha n=1 Tax=Sporosarcina sp. Marseille-Q4063 TaxID=2810514 RepID=UPI001BB082AC|nr:ribonucleoside-diphosphate reductase subunit alpha [Sporosarcina sp. Marseille-Q4063]QUW21019.1 ribonucleoside-diphosphate reductase subunit alpha [Sporosarcina sp. Marseille-Q4063]
MTTQIKTPQIDQLLHELQNEFGEQKIAPLLKVSERWKERHPEGRYADWSKAMVLEAISFVAEDETYWTFVAARIYLQEVYAYEEGRRGQSVYVDFAGHVKSLVEKGLYTPVLTEKYSEEDLNHLGHVIDPERDKLFTYIGLKTLMDRYVAVDFTKKPVELPQERWLIIAMTLMQDETENRNEKVSESYWAMSNLYMTVATPTLSNAGKPHGQLSSCFIDTVDDSLQGIYDSNTDIANLSKYGGGIGVYMGKVRSRGSSIRGFKGASSGVLPWIKQLNNTAVSVDQLGQRQGAIAVYLDVFHKDIFTFLDLKLNNGDERMRAHDIFTGVCLPDLYMEQVEARGDWHLFDPHEVREVMGYSLEDSYDEKRGEGSFREKYAECINHPELSRETVPAIDLMKRILRSQLETGVPFMFYRDEVNRANANKHEGMIYSSNLCSEIAQNQSATEFESVTLEDDIVVTRSKPGDFVVCNLSSINLGRAVPANVIERLIKIQVRMLDNVIDLNKIPVVQAARTNSRYRGIGLGTFGWHHLLALKNIQWESNEAVDYADELYERIAYLTISASMELSKEKGAYPLFEGSDWQTGDYFTNKGYDSKKWRELRFEVAMNGMRNGYLMAVAPNSSTSLLAGSTASIDPIFKPFFHEEKKDYKLPTVAPDLDHNTYDIYRRSAYIVDQRWSVKQNAARQRHIDQAISFNIYVPNTIRASVLLDLHIQAWKSGMKTTYYTRSSATDIAECEWCHS